MQKKDVQISEGQKEALEQYEVNLDKLVRESIDAVRDGEREIRSIGVGDDPHTTSISLSEFDVEFIEGEDYLLSELVRDAIDRYEPRERDPVLGKKGEMPPDMKQLAGNGDDKPDVAYTPPVKKFIPDSFEASKLNSSCQEVRAVLEKEVPEVEGGYVYVLLLDHRQKDEDWYYVGEVKSFNGLVKRIAGHISNPDFSVTMETEDSVDILRRIPKKPNVVRVCDIECIIPVEESEYGVERRRELERRVSYELAIEYETTNVLGGK